MPYKTKPHPFHYLEGWPDHVLEDLRNGKGVTLSTDPKLYSTQAKRRATYILNERKGLHKPTKASTRAILLGQMAFHLSSMISMVAVMNDNLARAAKYQSTDLSDENIRLLQDRLEVVRHHIEYVRLARESISFNCVEDHAIAQKGVKRKRNPPPTTSPRKVYPSPSTYFFKDLT